MTLERTDATQFFAAFFGGEHHIPGTGGRRGPDNVQPFGVNGWRVVEPGAAYSTFDYDQLTRLVFLAHEWSVRVQLTGSRAGLELSIWGREREGDTSCRHPDLDAAVRSWRQGPNHRPPAVTRG